MKQLFGIALVTLGAISQRKPPTSNLAKQTRVKYARVVDGKALCGRGSTIGGVTRTCRKDALLLVASQTAASPAYNQSTFVDKP